MIVYGDPLAVRFLCKTRASSRSARVHDTGSANRNTRTNGRVVRIKVVPAVEKQLGSQRGLADTTPGRQQQPEKPVTCETAAEMK